MFAKLRARSQWLAATPPTLRLRPLISSIIRVGRFEFAAPLKLHRTHIFEAVSLIPGAHTHGDVGDTHRRSLRHHIFKGTQEWAVQHPEQRCGLGSR